MEAVGAAGPNIVPLLDGVRWEDLEDVEERSVEKQAGLFGKSVEFVLLDGRDRVGEAPSGRLDRRSAAGLAGAFCSGVRSFTGSVAGCAAGFCSVLIDGIVGLQRARLGKRSEGARIFCCLRFTD